ncbi:uncharacterized protein LOC126739428 isoform X2 [Anthonomus grandis grandis]|uniref:uncharacterized protein LOC126739428 isoform X2 n=1 Tax=Anthonomus grandis grandis TaxID=2921223 RepID=UPI002166B8A2|nr:uncharacterized protein LOC126739428 isoform X2 [Anthonomus grandis grandis]
MSWPPIEPTEHCSFYSFLTFKRFPHLNLTDAFWSIMSGDSPLHNNRTTEAFDFSSGTTDQDSGRPRLLDSKPVASADGRTSPVASGSRDVAVQNSQPNQEKGDKEEVQASVIVEPGGKEKNDDEKDGFASSTLNNDEDEREHDKEGEEQRRGRNNDGEFGGGRDKKDRKDDKFKKNGNVDKLDGVFSAKGKKQKKKKDDEDDCMVKCLYVTMTCCECSIM